MRSSSPLQLPTPTLTLTLTLTLFQSTHIPIIIIIITLNPKGTLPLPLPPPPPTLPPTSHPLIWPIPYETKVPQKEEEEALERLLVVAVRSISQAIDPGNKERYISTPGLQPWSHNSQLVSVKSVKSVKNMRVYPSFTIR